MNRFTKTSLFVGAILIIYGYLCRAIGIYFFWESKYFGWSIIILGLIGILFSRVKLKKSQSKKSILEKIGIGILILVLIVQVILISVIPNTDAYEAAKVSLMNNTEIRNKIGTINSFSFIPLGGMQQSSQGVNVSGEATLNLTLKGEKKYIDVTVNLIKTPGIPWTVVNVSY